MLTVTHIIPPLLTFLQRCFSSPEVCSINWIHCILIVVCWGLGFDRTIATPWSFSFSAFMLVISKFQPNVEVWRCPENTHIWPNILVHRGVYDQLISSPIHHLAWQLVWDVHADLVSLLFNECGTVQDGQTSPLVFYTPKDIVSEELWTTFQI